MKTPNRILKKLKMLNFLKPNLVFSFRNVNIKYQNPTLPPRSSDLTPTLSDSERFCIFADVKEYPSPKPCRRQEPAQLKPLIYIMKIGSQQIGRGKLGNAIYAQVGGECIARQYQPNVFNPSTAGQVQQRAKMKLITQLGAILSPVLAYRKDGLVSARNKFVSRNIGATYYSDGAASVRLPDIQFTEGNVPLIPITVERSENNYTSAHLTLPADPSLSRVVYLMYVKTNDGVLKLSKSAIIEGTDSVFTWNINQQTALPVIIYAYGMIDTNERATAKYADLNVATATMLASLIASRTLAPTDYRLTETVSWASQDTPVPVNP